MEATPQDSRSIGVDWAVERIEGIVGVDWADGECREVGLAPGFTGGSGWEIKGREEMGSERTGDWAWVSGGIVVVRKGRFVVSGWKLG